RRRLVEPAGDLLGDPQVVMELGVIGIEDNGPRDQLGRDIVAAAAVSQHAQQVKGISVARVLFEDLPATRLCLLQPAGLEVCPSCGDYCGGRLHVSRNSEW